MEYFVTLKTTAKTSFFQYYYRTHLIINILQSDNMNKQVREITNVFIKSSHECTPFVTKLVRRQFAPWIVMAYIKLRILVRNTIRINYNKDHQKITQRKD